MLYKEIPFLRIGLPFCTGIISGLIFSPGPIFLTVISIVIIIGFTFSFITDKLKVNLLFGFIFMMAMYLLGLLLYTNERKNISELESSPTIYHCFLCDYPEEKENSYKLTVKLNSVIKHLETETKKGSLLIYMKKDSLMPLLIPGDELIVKCSAVEIVNKGNPYEFDYRFYMQNRGIRYYAFINSSDILAYNTPSWRLLRYKALILRNKIIEMYKTRGIEGDRLAVVAAITMGQKNMLDPEQKQNFIEAGVIHIMAVSGLHAVILSMFVFQFLFFMKRRLNILRVIIAIIILWVFAFVTGLTPSVLRATIMFTFINTGKLMNRKVNNLNSVLASAFIILLIRPSSLFNAGFQLSYSAVIFIIVFYQNLYAKLHFKKWIPDKIWQSVVITIVAQAATFPLSIMLFNRFPTYFIITNIIIVPLTTLIILTSCFVPLTYPILFISRSFASFVNLITFTTERLTQTISGLPYSTIDNVGFTLIESTLLILTIFTFGSYLLRKKSISIIYPLVFLLLFISANSYIRISTKRSSQLIVFNNPGESTISIRSGRRLYVYSDNPDQLPEISRYSSILRLDLKTKTVEAQPLCIKVGKKQILISNIVNNKLLDSYKPDIVVVTGSYPQINYKGEATNPPEALIITSGVTQGFKIPNSQLVQSIDTIHLVKNSGAFSKMI